MNYRVILTAMAVVATASPVLGESPRLAETGILVTETASRVHLGGEAFYLGDLLYVQVVCPPDAGETAVSAHMEYEKRPGEWVPVPASDSAVGQAYTSARYPGLRDYVRLRPVTERTQRHVSLFMPYDAAAMPSGTYTRRYIIRLWDKDNNDVARTILPSEMVEVKSLAGRTIITVVKCRACCQVMTDSKTPLEPQPEAIPPGAIHFFDARTGGWLCPGKLERQTQ